MESNKQDNNSFEISDVTQNAIQNDDEQKKDNSIDKEDSIDQRSSQINPSGFFPQLNDNDACSVAVAVRIRPLVGRELTEGNRKLCINQPEGSYSSNVLQIGQKSFEFDKVFWQDDSQEFIFDTCTRNLVLGCFHGYNATILAYGQTGSGKTHSMGTGSTLGLPMEKVGIVPRVFKFIFDELDFRKSQSEYSEFKVRVSFLELYNEELHDLLDIQAKGKTLQQKDIQIREEKNGTITVKGLKENEVRSQEECLHLLNSGINHRVTSSTLMNEGSSRSHAIFTISIEQKIIKDVENEKSNDKESAQTTEEISSKFHFVDLAGSERIKKTGAQGQQLKEGISINRGLLCLGQVISALTEEKAQKNHIPYRDSKLTRILQDSLGGNSRTTMIACVSPSESNYEESLSTIRYASRARNIKNKPIVNRDPNSVMIENLRSQIQNLQMELKEYASIIQTQGITIPSDLSQRIFQRQKEEKQDQVQKKTQLMIQQSSNQQQSQSSNSNEVKDLKIKLSNKEKEIKELQHKIQEMQLIVDRSNQSFKELEKEKDNIFIKYEAMEEKLKQNNIEFDPKQFDQKQGENQSEIVEKKGLIEQYKQKISKYQKESDQKSKDLQEKDKVIQDLQSKLDQSDKILKKHINENQLLKRNSQNGTSFIRAEPSKEVVQQKKDFKALRDQRKENSAKQFQEFNQKFLSGLESQFDEILKNSSKKQTQQQNTQEENQNEQEEKDEDNKDDSQIKLEQEEVEKQSLLENVKKFAMNMLSDMQERDEAAGNINNLQTEKIKAENERKENLIKAKNDDKAVQNIEKEYRQKMDALNIQLQKQEKEKAKKEESVAKQIAMQEARIKSLESDISKWKKKKEEVEIARKYDEDRFFKFKQNTSKQIEKEKKTLLDKQKEMEKLKSNYKKVDQLAQQAISQLKGIQKKSQEERSRRLEIEERENLSNGIDIDLIKDWITQNTEAMLKHDELKTYKQKQLTEKDKIENEMLEEGDRLTEILLEKEKLEYEKEEQEALGDDQKDIGRIEEIDSKLKDLNLEIQSISETLDNLSDTLEFIQSKLNQVIVEIESFDMESIAPLEFGALDSIESARVTLKTFFQVLLELNVYKRDLEKKCLDQDGVVIELEQQKKELDLRLKFMKENGGHDGYQAYVDKQAVMASFITSVEGFVDNRDIEHLNLNLQEQTNLTKLSLSKIVNNLKKKLTEQETKNQRVSLKLDQTLKEKLKLQAKIDEIYKQQKTSSGQLLPKSKVYQGVGAKLTAYEAQNQQQIVLNQSVKSLSFKDRQIQKKDQEHIIKQQKQTESLADRRKNKKNIIEKDELDNDLDRLKQKQENFQRDREKSNDSKGLEGVQEEDDEYDEVPMRQKQTGMELTIIGEGDEPFYSSVLEPSYKNNDLFSYDEQVKNQGLLSNKQIEPDQNHSSNQIMMSEKRSIEVDQTAISEDKIKEYLDIIKDDDLKLAGNFIIGQRLICFFDNFEVREISLVMKELNNEFNLQEIEGFEISDELEKTSIVSFITEKDLQIFSVACEDSVHIFDYSDESGFVLNHVKKLQIPNVKQLLFVEFTLVMILEVNDKNILIQCFELESETLQSSEAFPKPTETSQFVFKPDSENQLLFFENGGTKGCLNLKSMQIQF